MQLFYAALRRITGDRFVKICAITFLLVAVKASAQDTRAFWIGPDANGGVPGKWEDTANWQNAFPDSSRGVLIGNGQSGDPKVNGTATIDSATANANAGTLILGAGTITAGGEDNGTLYLNGGTLTISGNPSIGGATTSFAIGGSAGSGSGGSGTFIMNDGTLIFNGTNGGMLLGLTANATDPKATGYFEMNGGSINFVNNTGGNHLSLAVRGQGTMKMTGGSINLNGGSFDISRAGGNATLLMTGGTLTTNIVIGATAANGNGTVVLDGGTINATTFNLINASGAAAASLDVKSGTLSISGNLIVANGTTTTGTGLIEGGSVGFAGATIATGTLGTNGTLTITGGRVKATNAITIVNNAGSSGTLSIQGGIVMTGSINTSGSSGTGAAASFLSISGTNTEVLATRIGQSANGATMRFNGGTLTVGTFGCALNNAQWNGGTLSPGDFTQVGGGAAFGTTLFTASNNAFFTQGAGHHIHIDLGDNGLNNPLTANRDYIQLNTSTTGSGTATLNGTIDVEFVGTNPTLGAVYDILKAAVANGIIDNSTLLSHTPGIEFSKSIVTTTNTNDTLRLTITAVPEPSMIALVGVGAMALLKRKSRRPRGPVVEPLAA